MAKGLRLILSVVLSVCLTAGAAFAAESDKGEAASADETADALTEVKTDTDAETAAELLEKLGIIQSADDFDAAGEINRGYFTALAARAVKADVGGADIRTIFRDVAPDYKYANEIIGMYRLGYVKGDTDRCFYPENSITYNEAITILINCLGFSARAESRGGFPSGYAAEARRIGLPAVGTDGGALSQGAAAKLIREMLESDAAIASGVKDGETVYNVEKNLLSKIYKVYMTEGTVTENGVTGLDTGNANENQIRIGDLRINNNTGENPAELLGIYVKAYWRDDNGAAELVMICDEGRSTIYDLTGWENDVKYNRDENSVQYYDGKKRGTQSLRLSDGFRLIYNGKAEEDYLKYLSDLGQCRVRVIRDRENGLCNVVIVEKYTIIVAGAVNADMQTVSDLYDTSISAKLEDIYRTEYFDAYGKKTDFSAISKGDVVCLYISNDKEYARVIKCANTVVGRLDLVVANEDKYVIGGKEYRVTPAVKDGAVKLEAGDSGTFGLDIFGRIASFSKDKAEGEGFGLLIGYRTDGVFESTVSVRLVSEYHDIRTYELAENVLINGKSSKNTSVYDIIKTAAAVNDTEGEKEDVIKYKVNDEDKISSIDFALSEPPILNTIDDGTLYMYKTKKSRFYKADTGNFQDEYVIDKTKTVVFGVDANYGYGDENRYFVMSGSQFSNDSWPTTEAYTTKKEPEKADAIVYYGTQPSSNLEFLAINSLTETMDEEGDRVYAASGFTQGGNLEVRLSPELVNSLNLTEGDIIGKASRADAKGVIVDTKLIYDWSEDKIVEDGINQAIFDSRAFGIFAYSYSGSVIKWIKAADREDAKALFSNKNLTENDLSSIWVPSSGIFVADGRNRDEIYKKGTMADIVGYTQNPENFSRVIVRSLWGNTQRVFIFNR